MLKVALSTAVRCGVPLDRALQDLSEAGVRRIDLLAIEGWAHVSPSDLVREWQGTVAWLEALLGKWGLEVAALNVGVGPALYDQSPRAQDERFAQLEALFRLAGRWGIPVVALQPGGRDPHRDWEQALPDVLTSLASALELAQQLGVTLALELHIHSPFETLHEASALFSALPGISVAYDPSHFLMQGVDLKDTAFLLDRAATVHLRDAAHGKMQVPLGEGDLDLVWVLDALTSRGYSGTLTVEYLESSEFDALESSLALHRLLHEILPDGR